MSQNNKDIRISTYVDIDTALDLQKRAGEMSMASFVRQILTEDTAKLKYIEYLQRKLDNAGITYRSHL